jgi:hypothetical protein
LAYYDFTQSPVLLAILEQVNKQTSLLTINTTDRNIDQTGTGSVIAYGSGEAALDVGYGLVVQGLAATNEVPYSTPSTGNWTDTGSVISVGGISPDTSKSNALVTMDAATGTNFIFRNSEVTSGVVYANYIIVKKQAEGWIQVEGSTGLGSGKYVNVSLLDGMIGFSNLFTPTVKSIGDYLQITLMETASLTGSARLLFGYLGSNINARRPSQTFTGAESYEFYHAQLESGSPSSPIYTNGAPVTRSADDSTISTYTELGAFLETPANSTVATTLANNNVFGFTKGVNTGAGHMTFAGSGEADGKYVSLVAPGIVGAIISAGNSQALVSGYVNTSTFAYTMIKGDVTDFEYPSIFNVDWSRTGILEADVINVRIAAGDANVWPTAVPWSTTFKLEYQDVDWTTAVINQVMGHSGDAKLYHDGTNMVASIGATTSTIAIAASSVTSAAFQYDGANVVVWANGVAGTGTASVAPTLGATWQINADTALANGSNGLIGDIVFT